MIYVRWKKGESRRGKEFTGLDAAIQALICPICYEAIKSPYTIVAVGPVDIDEVHRYEMGKWFNAGACLAHTSCLDITDDHELDKICRQLIVLEDRKDTGL